jgi:hypothetical protein
MLWDDIISREYLIAQTLPNTAPSSPSKLLGFRAIGLLLLTPETCSFDVCWGFIVGGVEEGDLLTRYVMLALLPFCNPSNPADPSTYLQRMSGWTERGDVRR